MRVIVEIAKAKESEYIKEGLLILGVELGNPLLIKAAAYINASEKVRKDQKKKIEKQGECISGLLKIIESYEGGQ